MRRAVAALALLGLFVAFHARCAPGAQTAAGDSGHGGPVVPVLLGLVIVLGAAKLGGELFERLGQPAVLGELLFGMVLGNLSLVGYGGLGFLATEPGLEILAQLGVILLLFQVGLESNVQEMMSVGGSSLLVAVLGVMSRPASGQPRDPSLMTVRPRGPPGRAGSHVVRPLRPRPSRPPRGRRARCGPRRSGHPSC